MDKLAGVQHFRVRYNEGDSMGVTYHGNYFDWFVIGRTELLRDVGLPYAELERGGLLLPVLDATCRYIVSTRYDDAIRLETELTGLTRTRMSFAYRVFLETEADSVLAAEGETKHVFVDARHRPVDIKKRFPDVWAMLEPFAR